jgi:8-oxo-dGTP pyrophosphatase MutT (NUDIX family)
MLFPRADGDGWTRCALGHRHWGLFGAAGLLLRSGDLVLLQHRALWSHHGGTWGLLGGARHRDESPAAAAAREAAEEAGLDPATYEVTGESTDDHGGWTYTTVLARAPEPVVLTALTEETLAVAWVPEADVTTLPLHPGFAATWPLLRVA